VHRPDFILGYWSYVKIRDAQQQRVPLTKRGPNESEPDKMLSFAPFIAGSPDTIRRKD
jgi:hypothetical protein